MLQELESYKEVEEDIIDQIQEIFRLAGKTKAIIGVSGGKDSTVALHLCCRALGPENVIGVIMPDGEQSDFNDAYNLCKSLDILYSTINILSITKRFDALVDIETECASEDWSNITVTEHSIKESKINIRPRVRMTVLRALGQAYDALLCGTGNASEIYVGYFTKDGDSSCDFNPLENLTSIQVVELGLAMGIDPKLMNKVPSDGISGKTDEEKLGVSYKSIHDYLTKNLLTEKFSDEEIEEFKKIKELHEKSLHKLENGRSKIYP